jgi:outer membrane cobalamin receptor
MPFRSAGVAREGRVASDLKSSTFDLCQRLFGRVTLATAVVVSCGAWRYAAAADDRRNDASVDGSADADDRDGSPPIESPATLPPRDGGATDSRSSPAGATDPQGAGPHQTRETDHSVVTARRGPAAAPREDLTAAASVLTPDDSPRALDDLGTLLLQVPGANVTRRGGIGSFTTISLRGSNPDEVRVYIDGIPLNQAVGGAVDLSTLPLGDVERVEVYRGSTPIAFGESALGGVVSITTRTPGAPHATARAGVGSFRTTFGDGTAGGKWGPVRIYLGMHALSALGDFPQMAPVVPAGYQPTTRENNDLLQLDGVLRAAMTLPGRRELRGGIVGVWRDQGLPAEDHFRSSARARTTRALAQLDYESRDDLGESSRLRAALFASQMQDAFSDPLHQIVGIVTATHDRARSLGTTATAEKALGGWGRLTGLLEGRAEEYLPRNDADPEMPAGYPASRQVATAGFELDARWERLKVDVLPSARLEASRDVRTGRSLVFGTHLPPAPALVRALPILRIGLLRSLGDGAALRANVGSYARIPSFLELYGYNRGVLGNPTLRPERGVNADVGASIQREGPRGTGGLLASANLFGARVEDLIAWETYSAQTRAQNVSRALIWGVEAELRIRLTRLTIISQATHTDARDKGSIAASANQQLAYHPRNRGYGRAEWRQPFLATRCEVTLYVDLEGSSGNFRATNVYGGLPPRLLLGAGLALEDSRTGLRLAGSMLNLGDSRVSDFPGYPQPGRSVFVALGWRSPVHNP